MSNHTKRFINKYCESQREADIIEFIDLALSYADDIYDNLTSREIKDRFCSEIVNTIRFGKLSKWTFGEYMDVRKEILYIHDALGNNLKRSKLADIAVQMSYYSKKCDSASTVDDYIHSSYNEGFFAMALLLQFFDNGRIPKEDREFLLWIAGAGNLYDNILDLKKDYENEEIVLEPSFMVKFKMYKYFIHDVMRSVNSGKIGYEQLKNILASGIDVIKHLGKTQKRNSALLLED